MAGALGPEPSPFELLVDELDELDELELESLPEADDSDLDPSALDPSPLDEPGRARPGVVPVLVEADPLSTIPTGEKTLRECAAKDGHTVRVSSLIDCWISNSWPQSRHRYS